MRLSKTRTKSVGLPARVTWLEHSLQGLAFWIGHRQSMFRDYPLSEGALVAETCNLIQANIPPDLVLLPECMYKNLVNSNANLSAIGKQARADLVLCKSDAKQLGRDGLLAPYTKFVIEVKRANASRQSIDEDMLRLCHYLKAATQDVRCFLVIVSEGKAPRRFVKNGKSILGSNSIRNCDGYYRVRRSLKAAASFSGKEKAHFVCLIEIFDSAHRTYQHK